MFYMLYTLFGLELFKLLQEKDDTKEIGKKHVLTLVTGNLFTCPLQKEVQVVILGKKTKHISFKPKEHLYYYI